MVGEKLFRNKYIRITGIIIGILLIVKYLFPLVIPFLVAGFLSWILLPIVRFLHKRTKLPTGLLASLLLLLIGGSLGVLLWYLLMKLMDIATRFLCNLDSYKECFICVVHDCSGRIEKMTGICGDDVEELIMDNANIFVNNLQITYLPKFMDHSYAYLANVVKVIGTIMITAISTVFIIQDYDVILETMKKREMSRKILHSVKRVLHLTILFLKAQLIIMGCIMALLVVVFWFLGIKGAVFNGVVIGFLDALPFIGTGLVLVPWALVDVVRGSYYLAVAKVVLFFLCSLIREIMEPKLMSQKTGILPILMLMSVYVGICLFGIFGIFVGPMLLLLVVELKDFW